MGMPGGRKEGMPPNAPGAGPGIPICILWAGSMGRIGPPAPAPHTHMSGAVKNTVQIHCPTNNRYTVLLHC